jgi:hypothetical protein
MNFIEEVKAAIDGKWFRKPKYKRKKIHKTAEEICIEELYKPTYENRKV